jgi:chlorite dismutase
MADLDFEYFVMSIADELAEIKDVVHLMSRD